MVAIYQGEEKPTTDELIGEVVAELKRLKFHDQSTVEITERGFYVKLRQIRADRPARSTLKCITNASGYCSCERCQTFGMLAELAKESRKVVPRPSRSSAPSASGRLATTRTKALKRLQRPGQQQTSSSGLSTQNRQKPRPVIRRVAAVRASETIQQQASETMKNADEGEAGAAGAAAAAASSAGVKNKEEATSTHVVFPELEAPPRLGYEWRSYMIGVHGGPEGDLVSHNYTGFFKSFFIVIFGNIQVQRIIIIIEFVSLHFAGEETRDRNLPSDVPRC